MSKKSRKRRGSSKAGRPRQAGPRYKSGKLKATRFKAEAAERNEAILAARAMGHGVHPLDFALQKGWINEAKHRAGMRFAQTHKQAGLGGHGMSSGGPIETEVSQVDEPTINKSWTDDRMAVVTAWDTLALATPRSDQSERDKQAAAAMVTWKNLNAALSSTEQVSVYRACVEAIMPGWMRRLAEGIGELDEREPLLTGLDVLSKVGRKPKASATIQPVPAPRKARKMIEELNYVDESGGLLFTVEKVA